MQIISEFKEIFSNIIFDETKESIENSISRLEKIDFPTKEIEIELEKFKKPFPCPLYYFSFMGILKTTINLKQDLFRNYDYYLDIYLSLNQKSNRTTNEENLLEELKDLLYRMDDISGKFERISFEFLGKIKELIIANVRNIKDLKDQIYFVKITSKDYPQIYPIYENLILIVHTIIDELKIEKGIFKLTKLLLETEANK